MKKKTCKHTWTIIPRISSVPTDSKYGGFINSGFDVIAVCQKCLEKRYI